MPGQLDLDGLDDLIIQNLIKELKHPNTHIDNELIKSHFGYVNERCSIMSHDNKTNYTLSVYRGNRESGRFTVYLYFQETKHCLVRIDINGGQHINPDGSLSPKSHMHIYNNRYSMKDAVAQPIDLKDFPVINNLYDVYLDFLKYTNIK